MAVAAVGKRKIEEKTSRCPLRGRLTNKDDGGGAHGCSMRQAGMPTGSLAAMGLRGLCDEEFRVVKVPEEK